jgi:hypothetical protein
MPLGIGYPRHEIFRMETIPPVMYYTGNQEQTIRNPSFYFHRSVNLRGDTLTLEYEYNALADFVPVEGVPEYTRQLEQASDLLDFTIASYPE